MIISGMSALRKSLMSNRPPRLSKPRFVNYKPLKGSEYFTFHESIFINDGCFHYYCRGDKGPVILALHGGGYSALTWCLFATNITSRIECRVLAVDLRGHGSTETLDDDMSLDILAQDVCTIVRTVYPDNVPPIVLIGHSLGGAIAVEVAPLLPSVVGMCIIDIVEGTALDSLSVMQSILKGRPSTFNSLENAIQWSVRGGQTNNVDAARVSMPGQIKNLKTGVLAAEEVESAETLPMDDVKVSAENVEFLECDGIITILEDSEDSDEGHSSGTSTENSLEASASDEMKAPAPQPLYGWRIDLSRTEKYWCGWFKGLSQKFLNVPQPKILLMANIYGLDTSLTVGQMQGKFQLQVMPRCGHAIQEDRPDQVADIVATFIIKQKLGTAIGGFKPILPGC